MRQLAKPKEVLWTCCLTVMSMLTILQTPAMAETVDGNGNTLQGFIAAPLVQTSLDGSGNRLEGIVPGPFPLVNSVDGNGVGLSTAALLEEGTPTGEGAGDGEGMVEGTAEGVSEGTNEGTPEGTSEGTTEGTTEGEGISEGLLEGSVEGVLEGEGNLEGISEGSSDGEEENLYEQALFQFALCDTDANSRLTLQELLTQVPAFTLQLLQSADTNSDNELSVPELLEVSPRLVINSADSSGDYLLSLSEILRVVQLYNAGGYACATSPGATEDGYVPQSTPSLPTCLLHSLDSDGNNQISLSELLRGIQIFNFGGYSFCDGQGEDNFCSRP